MRVRNGAFVGNLFRSARLFSEAWRCAPTVVFSPRLDYTLVSLLFGSVCDYTLVSLLFLKPLNSLRRVEQGLRWHKHPAQSE
ncbi:BQ5605_C025g10098 [Microbotryum silenes-dioicae]|uniref:BQ5605_C025g10084 protein n=1 Tax=Microbotryum silenes-dioicae TaxID=796604 RepID=A0A2X0N8R6_9BASI|nr:BQ5605_C025g10084 [Microbotryum silenes-dioicae]SGZ27265.1 BQ5605_C025g10098 [Microbotryum silenes-dioicae]